MATFSSRHAGMGALHFTPVAGQRYRAAFSTPALAALSVPLPPVQASGYVLHVAPLADAFEVRIQQHGGAGRPVLLLGQVGSAVGYLGRGEVQGQEAFMARIPASKFASGIVHFTLFDGQGHPLAERLAFARGEGPLRVSLAPDQASYGPHQPVRVRVAVADAAGRPVATRLLLAVADAGATSAAADNIAARLLLTADLSSYVEEPGYYFEAPTADTDQALDDLLLTQGWRRFAWGRVMASQLPPAEFGLERSLTVLGQVTRPNGVPAAHSVISFLQATPTKQFISTPTDDEGRFLFTGFGGCDTVRATLQARSERGKRNVNLVLDPGPAWPTSPLPLLPTSPPSGLAAAIRNSQQQGDAEHQYLLATGHSIKLGNVSVWGQRASLEAPRRIYPYGSNLQILKMDNIPTASAGGLTVLQALRGRVAGLVISGTEPNVSVTMRGDRSFTGSNTPLVLLDGARTTIDVLTYYLAADVEKVEILRPGQAVVLGGSATDGAIAIYTRRGSPSYDSRKDATPGIVAVTLPGYSCPRQFYSPRYGTGSPAPTRPDTRRSTLYWNPDVRTDASGQAELTFYTSDAAGSFRLTAEGISAAGQPAVGYGSLGVK